MQKNSFQFPAPFFTEYFAVIASWRLYLFLFAQTPSQNCPHYFDIYFVLSNLIFLPPPIRCGFRTEERSGGKESATGRSNKPRLTSQPPTIYQCCRGPTATRRRVVLGVFQQFRFLIVEVKWLEFNTSLWSRLDVCDAPGAQCSPRPAISLLPLWNASREIDQHESARVVVALLITYYEAHLQIRGRALIRASCEVSPLNEWPHIRFHVGWTFILLLGQRSGTRWGERRRAVSVRSATNCQQASSVL